MLRSYVKIAFRNLVNNKVYSAINVIGLAIGMTVAILIGVWVWDEVSFNHNHSNHERLGEIASIETFNGITTTEEFSSVPIANALRINYTEAFKQVSLTRELDAYLKVGDKNFGEYGLWAESSFPSMFTLKIIKGSYIGFMDPTAILISESLAKNLFGEENPVNKSISINGQYAMKVLGVYENLPYNSRFTDVQYLLAWNDKNNPGNNNMEDWGDHHFQLFVQMNDHVSFDDISVKIKDLSKPHLKGGWEELMIHPMDRWHLYSDFVKEGRISVGRIQFVRLFGLIGVFVLILACINYMNLSTARSAKRAKEVGIRKTMGSRRTQLILQFIGESIMMSFSALLISIIGVLLSMPFFNQLAGKQLSLPFMHVYFWIGMLGFVVLTGLLAGSYPAFFLSGFKAINVLKGNFKSGRFAVFPRKILVVVQFTICIALIIGTIIVYQQIQYSRNRPIGYSTQRLITMEMNSPGLKTHFESIKNELLQTGAVENMASSSSPSTQVRNSIINYNWKGKDPNAMAIIGTVCVGYDFGKTIKWQMVDGRDFSREFSTDSGAFILNEAAVQFTGFKQPIGQYIHWHDKDHLIIGIVKNMVMESPYSAVQPTFFTLYNWKIDYITIRLKQGMPTQQSLAAIEHIFRKYDPENPFDYQFTADMHNQKFSDEVYIGNLSRVFCILAVLISSLGLFGLASYIAEQRTKEIAVRKVLGAGIFSLWKLLSFEFIILVVISCLIASPIAWYVVHQWLQKFDFRTPVYAWIFLAAGLGAMILAVMIVSYQAICAATANPVKSLKND
ncbi:MAG: ABC transporter permease [Ferruginibacter sp.]